MYTVTVPETNQFLQKSTIFLEQAKSLKISNDGQFAQAGEFLRTIKSGIKDVKVLFKIPKQESDRAHQAVCDAENSLLEPLCQAETFVKSALADYHVESEKKAREDRLRLNLEAKKRAEDEKLLEATRLEASGRAQAALQAISEPLNVPKAPKPVLAQSRGISFKERWVAEVTDFKALISAIVAGKAPQNLIEPNETALRQFATATRGNVSIPGVEFKVVKEVVGRI